MGSQASRGVLVVVQSDTGGVEHTGKKRALGNRNVQVLSITENG
jgi:hypothetical protein